MRAHSFEPTAPLPGPATEVRAPLRWLGLRPRALLEMAVLLVLAVLLTTAVTGLPPREAIRPEAGWAVVVLASAYYGTREGLAAALLATGLVLLGPLPVLVPPVGPALGTDAWLLAVFATPALWMVAALVLGYPRDLAQSKLEAQARTLATARQELDVITRAYPQLEAQQRLLEERVAAQSRTFQALYQASRAIEQPGVGEVLLGVKELVQAAIGPQKFSLFLLNCGELKVALQEGWNKGDAFVTRFERSDALVQAVIRRRRFLCITDPGDEPLLHGQGLLAGPVIETRAGAVVGMLKIEGLDFLDLHPTNIRNFQLVCQWLGEALARAQALQALVKENRERAAEEVAA